MLPAFLTTIFFSLSAVTGNRSARIFGGVEANFYRLTIAALLLGAYVYTFGQAVAGPAAWTFALSGFIGVGVGDFLFFEALPRLGSRLTVLLIQCLSVPVAALIEWFWLGTTMTPAHILWAAVVMSGIGLALFPDRSALKPSRTMMVGICLSVFAAIGNGAGAVLSRKAYLLAEETGVFVTGPTAAFQRVLGGLAVALPAILLARWSRIRTQVGQGGLALSTDYCARWKIAWPWVLATSLAGQTLGVTCFQWALKNHPTGVVLPIVAMTPLVAVPITHIFEGERPTAKSLIGGVIAVVGVIALLAMK